MMEYITRPMHYPGALSDTAASLLRCIYDAGVWFPEWREMTRCQIDAFAELQRAAYIEATAFFGYRVKGRDTILAARQHANRRNIEQYIRQAFVALGVEASNIRGVYHSPGGFAPRSNRWCVIFHRVPGLSANAVNAQPGLSGAVWNGNVCWVMVGKE